MGADKARSALDGPTRMTCYAKHHYLKIESYINKQNHRITKLKKMPDNTVLAIFIVDD